MYIAESLTFDLWRINYECLWKHTSYAMLLMYYGQMWHRQVTHLFELPQDFFVGSVLQMVPTIGYIFTLVYLRSILIACPEGTGVYLYRCELKWNKS